MRRRQQTRRDLVGEHEAAPEARHCLVKFGNPREAAAEDDRVGVEDVDDVASARASRSA